MKVVAPPTAEPVSLEQFKLERKIESDHENAVLQRALDGATEFVETATRIRLAPQGIEFTVDQPFCVWRFPVRPVIEVSEVRSAVIFEDETVIDPANYELADGEEAPSLHFAPDFTVPERFVVRATIGFGGPDGPVAPNQLRDAIIMLSQERLEAREGDAESRGAHIPWGVRAIIRQHRFQRICVGEF